MEEALRLNDLASKRVTVVHLCSQARAATRTRSSAAAAAVLAFSRDVARALSAAATVEGRGDSPQRKVVAEKGRDAGGMP
jgi:hypothetical protein